jgi:hypothetical protein
MIHPKGPPFISMLKSRDWAHPGGGGGGQGVVRILASQLVSVKVTFAQAFEESYAAHHAALHVFLAGSLCVHACNKCTQVPARAPPDQSSDLWSLGQLRPPKPKNAGKHPNT